MANPRRRSYSRSSSYDRKRRRSGSRDSYSRDRHYDRSYRDRYDRYDRYDRHQRRRSPRYRSPRRGGISNPPPGHPESNPGNNIYVASLPLAVDEDELKELFGQHGAIKEVRIIRDPFTKESRGFGFVTFEEVEDASLAVEELDKFEIRGQQLRVEKARRSRPHENTPGSYCGPIGASSKEKMHRRRRSPSTGRRPISRSGSR